MGSTSCSFWVICAHSGYGARPPDAGLGDVGAASCVGAGGSGCGCSAAVFNGYLLTGLKQGRWRRILFAPTGALLSPTSSFQGESIPGICHLVCVSTER